MTSEPNAEFATFAATINALKRLNLGMHNLCIQPNGVNTKTGMFVLNRRTDTGWAEAIGHVYECPLGYHCVVVERNIWGAPIVWNGPRAPWDTSTDEDTLTEFAAHVHKALTSA